MLDRSLLVELYQKTFGLSYETLVEMTLNEQYISLPDWENPANVNRFGIDDKKQPIGSREIELAYDDIVKTVAPGSSISKSKNIFLPRDFAIDKDGAKEVMWRLLAWARENGSVKVSVWPAYGIPGTATYPAYAINVLPADERSMAAQTGLGGAIYQINGQPLSRVLSQAIPLRGREGLTDQDILAKWAGGEDTLDDFNDDGGEGGFRKNQPKEAPPWLLEILQAIGEATAGGKVKMDVARMTGFRGNLLLYTAGGDAVLVISRNYAEAGFVFRKKMNVNGPVDFDVAVDQKMKELQAGFKRKPRRSKARPEESPLPQTPGEMNKEAQKAAGQLERAGADLPAARQPKLALRDWLRDTDNGIMLRRDYRKEDIKRLLVQGVNYESAKSLADHDRAGTFAPEPAVDATAMAAAESFERKLSAALRPTILEGMDGFINLLENPWAADKSQVFEYLKNSPPEDLIDWVGALEIVAGRAEDSRWLEDLIRRTYEELPLNGNAKARLGQLLDQMNAADWQIESQVDNLMGDFPSTEQLKQDEIDRFDKQNDDWEEPCPPEDDLLPPA